MSQMTVRDLASKVAREIDRAAKNYDGPLWEADDNGRERVLPFTVTAPSLLGESPGRLKAEGGQDFSFLVYSAASGSYVSSSGRVRPMRVLSEYEFILEVGADGFYTGRVTVWMNPRD